MRLLAFNALLLLASAAQAQPVPLARSLPPAPVARTNWAVAKAGDAVFAFHGLGPGKTSRDIAHDTHALDLRTGRWRQVGEVPVEQGRLASVAVTVAGSIYLFGGYTVSDTGEEVSTPEVWRFTPATGRFAKETTMPTPVDDTVAMAWRDRWIVLVSGWHDRGNVADVQFYDTRTQRWNQGTPWPGTPVFGHVGGLVDDTMVVCDGVTATKRENGKNQYAITDACWKGVLDPKAVGTIDWQRIPAHPGAPLYRAGAVGDVHGDASQVVFAGGSPRPYNYNGIGYDGVPSEPSAAVFAFDTARDSWTAYAPMTIAGMDFRGLVPIDDGSFALFGGMRGGQQVSGDVIRFRLEPAR